MVGSFTVTVAGSPDLQVTSYSVSPSSVSGGGTVTDVRIAGISATQTAFVLRVVFEGQAAIVVR
jgi:hypothetical protein